MKLGTRRPSPGSDEGCAQDFYSLGSSSLRWAVCSVSPPRQPLEEAEDLPISFVHRRVSFFLIGVYHLSLSRRVNNH